MDFNNIYYQQAKLLIQLLSFIKKEECFALKGGTAINLFFRDFPRFSVDIDLVYLPLNSRDEGISEIHKALTNISNEVRSKLLGITIQEVFQNKEDALRLIVSQNKVQVKIELSPVLRGVVYPSEIRTVHPKVEDEFGFAEMKVASFEDIYAGKICAALDRQHPRDLYDVHELLKKEGISENLRKAFIVYLISHSRPIHEILSPKLKSISSIFKNEFDGMTFQKISIKDLEETRVKLIKMLPQQLTQDEVKFLITFLESKPDWSLLKLNNIENLPAVQWKQINLKKLPSEKIRSEIGHLMKLFS